MRIIILFVLGVFLLPNFIFAQRGARLSNRSFTPQHNFYHTHVFIRNNFYRNTSVRFINNRITFRNVPRGANFYNWRGRNFYFHNGFYYERFNNRFNYIFPPIGFRIHLLPSDYYRYNFGGLPYYYYQGVFYIQDNNEYVVKLPPIGSIVNDFPETAANQVDVDGKMYYELGGCFFEKYTNQENKLVYEYVGTKEDLHLTKTNESDTSIYPNN